MFECRYFPILFVRFVRFVLFVRFVRFVRFVPKPCPDTDKTDSVTPL